MRELSIKQILMAHPVEFVANAIKEFAKKKSVETFILDDLNDFSYLIDDLMPDAIIIHNQLYSENKESVNRELQGKEITLILVGQGEGEDLYIPEPIDPANIVGQIQELLVSKFKDH